MKKREAVLEVFETLRKQNYLACYWKSPDGLNDALDVVQKDVDLLCKHEPTDVLHTLGFKKFRPQQRHRLRGVSHWVKPVEEGFCHLHVHERIYTGSTAPLSHRIPWVEYILHHCVVDQKTGIPIPIPEVDFLLLLARYAFEKKITKKILKTSMRRTTIESIIEHTSLVLGKGRGKKLGKALRKKSMPSRKKIHALFKNGLEEIRSPTLSSGKFALRSAEGMGRLSYDRFKPDLLPDLRPMSKGLSTQERGLVIAVLGPDGSGKSTLTTALEKWLEDIFNVHKVYFGRGDIVSQTWQSLAKVKWALRGGVPIEKLEEGKRREKLTYSEKKNQEKGPKKIVRNLARVALADRKNRDAEWVADAREQGAIVITDRFPVPGIELLDGAKIHEDGTMMAKVFSKVEHLVLDRITLIPDLVFRLNISPETAWKRKPDHHLEDIRAKVEALKGATFPHSELVEIDASKSEAYILAQTQKIIWDAL